MYLIFSLALLWTTATAQDAPCTETCWQNCTVEPRCPSRDGPKVTVLSYPLSCEKFIKCQSGHGCLHNCPSGLHFNEKTGTCDWPHLACCDECIPDEDWNSNCDVHPDCPAMNQVETILLPHSDCTKFFKCDRGQACEYTCPEGLHFNKQDLACDWPWRACCDQTIDCSPCPTCPTTRKSIC